MVIREDSTVYELLHELMHFRDCQQIGVKAFMQKPLVAKEKFVFDKMMEHSKYLKRQELEHAEWYINSKYKEFGITDNLGNPLQEKLLFDLRDIPKKRQGISIDQILTLK